MTQTSVPFANASPLSRAARLGWLIVILATLYLSYFHNLGVMGLVGPDEPRYAWIARDMAESGDWVTPRLYGKPWFEKPVLYYWGAALSFKWFGVSEAAARLPSAVAALLATLATAWLAWRVYGAEVARWLLLLLPTSVGMIGFSHAAATDMPFAAMLTIAMVFGAVVVGLVPSKRVASAEGANMLATVGLGFFLGLAVLAKGPAAIVLSGGAVLFWAMCTKRWRDGLRCLHPLAIAGFCATALPWYVLCARRNPDFFRIFIVEHNFKRYLTPEFQHLQPFWFYLPILLMAFLPWMVLLLWSAVAGVQSAVQRQSATSVTIFLLCWTLFPLIFFSISKSKLPGYILPSIPAFGILIAKEFVGTRDRVRSVLRWSLISFAVLLALLALLLGTIVRYGAGDHRFISVVPLLLAVANYLASLKEGKSPSASVLAPTPVLALLLLLPKLLMVVLPFDPSGKSVARGLELARVPVDQIFVWKMPRGQHFSLNFYERKEVPEWNPQQPQEGYLLLRTRSCADSVKKPWVCPAPPQYLPSSGYFVFRVEQEALVASLGGALGNLRRADNLGVGRDRQAR